MIVIIVIFFPLQSIVFEKLSSMIDQIKNLFFLTVASSHTSSRQSLKFYLLSLHLLFYRYFISNLLCVVFSFNNQRCLILFIKLDIISNRYFFFMRKMMQGVFIAMFVMTLTITLTNAILIISFFNQIFNNLYNRFLLNYTFHCRIFFIDDFFLFNKNPLGVH